MTLKDLQLVTEFDVDSATQLQVKFLFQFLYNITLLF